MKSSTKFWGAVLITIALLTVSFCGCGGSKGEIVVGSKIDTEGALLSQMIILMLDDAGYQVVDKSQFGTTPIVKSALESGELDIYPEYTGNGAFFFDEADSAVWKDAQAGYARVKELDLAANNIVWLEPAPANNTWALAIPEDLSQSENIVTLDDFAAYVNGGGYVKLAASEEFVTSPAALPTFQDAYGFTLSNEQLLTFAGGNTSLTEQAASEGTSGVNTAMAYGTDGQLSAYGLVVLADPRGAQPVYEPAPRVRGEILEKYPEIADILNPVFNSLDLVSLQTLNGRIAVNGEEAVKVAQSYLEENGFLN